MRRTATVGLASLCLAVPLLIVFGPVLFRDRQFAFQDAGHYYYPLLQRVQQEWDAGRWPLWAPEASAGTPLIGNPTAAVLYPGKLVFSLLPFPWAMRAYIVGHVAIAFGAMWWLLRGWKVSAAGSILGALSYAFGVPVLSQTSNQIFLVGAAWGPLGFLAADRVVRLRSRRAVPGLALVLAMEILGGDPETAYVTLLCAAGYALGLAAARSPVPVRRWLPRAGAGLALLYVGLLALSWWSIRATHDSWHGIAGTFATWKPTGAVLVASAWAIGMAIVARKALSPGGEGVRRFVGPFVVLALAAGLALMVAGAQLLPIVEYSGMSFRAAEAEGFHDIYPYSAHPLQLLDAIWPSVFGSLEGGYRSWLNALPPKPDSRFWMPSIYVGGLTLILALAAAGVRDGPPWRAWLSLVALVSGLASLGYYSSPLCWARYVPGWASWLGPPEAPFSWQVRTDGYLRDGDGGAYWFLASAFPGFGSFRYPPKLFVVWSLAVAGLGGLGWDRLAAGGSRRATRVAGFLLAASLVALAASWVGSGPLRVGFERLGESLEATDEPLDAARAIADLRMGLGHGAVVAAFALGLAALALRRPAWAAALAVAGLGIDLCAANAYHVITAPQSAFEGTPRALEAIREAERENPSPGPYRVARVGGWWPTRWSNPDGSPRRFDEIARWERNTLRPHHGQPVGVRSTFYFDTLEPVDYGLFFLPWSLTPDPAAVSAHGLKPGQKVWYYPRRGFDLWNTRYFIVPARLVWDSPARGYAAFVPRSTFVYPPIGTFDGPDGPARREKWEANEDFRLLRNEAALPRAWVVHRASLSPPIRGLKLADRTKTMQELLYQQDEFWRLPGAPTRDPRSVAWVETERPKEVDAFLSRADPDPSEAVTFTRDDPQDVEMTATLRTPGLVVVSDMYYPGWELTVDGKPAEILRANRAMRGVALPAGTHRLAFHYNPRSFRLGLVLSTIGLIAVMTLGVRSLRGARPSPEGNPA